jgi:hypothetical protein
MKSLLSILFAGGVVALTTLSGGCVAIAPCQRNSDQALVDQVTQSTIEQSIMTAQLFQMDAATASWEALQATIWAQQMTTMP